MAHRRDSIRRQCQARGGGGPLNVEAAAFLERAELSVLSAQNQVRDGMPAFAASRAYYAMFYAASALLADRGVSLSKHSGVSSKFGELFAKTGEIPSHLHRYLIDAFELRQVADYAVLREVTTEKAELHIGRAREFVAAVRDYIATHDPNPADA
jgi:uncharacterized protein (UPF0332 family)